MKVPEIRMPESWLEKAKSSILNTISLAHYAIICTRSICANSPLEHVRLRGKLERARNEISLLKEEIRIKDARFMRIKPRNRPHYSPLERMAILELKAARGWNNAQAAKAFMIDPDTIYSWSKRIGEKGKHAFIQTPEPINKFPRFVTYIVQRLKVLCPTMGKRKLADCLSRAGLALSASTVRRFLKRKPDPPLPPPENIEKTKQIKSKYPNHIWNTDLTVIPTSMGFWVRWFPFSLPLRWPFCYWAGVIVDHFSRTCIGFALFKKKPCSREIQRMLKKAFENIRGKPKHLICDRGKEFDCKSFRIFCKKHNIGLRYGAVQKHGSISVVERFIKTLKDECTRRILVPLDLEEMRDEVSSFVVWYNCFRPHQGFKGKFPIERYLQKSKRKRKYRVKGYDPETVKLSILRFKDKKHLPIIKLRKVG